MTRDRDIAAIVLFLVCAGAFAYTGWSRPEVALFTAADASVYRESYRECEQQSRERSSGPAPRPVAMAAAWAGRYERDRRPAARRGCLDAITGKPPEA